MCHIYIFGFSLPELAPSFAAEHPFMLGAFSNERKGTNLFRWEQTGNWVGEVGGVGGIN